MSNRISTAGMHDGVVTRMLARQADLYKTQTQVASGLRVQTPADDPVATTQILAIDQYRSRLVQYGKNADAATSRLEFNEQTFAQVSDTLQRVRELALQANSGTLDTASRSSIVAELRTRLQELEAAANRRDASGEYLFSGMASHTQPFSRSPAGVVLYNGDQGSRQLQLSSGQKVADGFNGQTAFMDIPEGNGTFRVAEGVHAGASSIDTGSVTSPALWVADSYTLQYTAAGDWQVTGASSGPVATIPYTSGAPITFNGVQVTISGTPAIGDTYSIAPAGNMDLFTGMDQLIAAVGAATDDPVGRASFNTHIGIALAQIDQSLNQVINLRAETGARLNMIDTQNGVRQELDDSLASTVSDLRDLDYADAVSRMNQQMLGLQAAQQAYTRISQLSLFNYL